MCHHRRGFRSRWNVEDIRPEPCYQNGGRNTAPRTANVCFQVDGQHIWAHKQVLTQACLYFHRMFQPHWIEDGKRDFTVNLFDYGIFYTFLKYLYTNELNRPFCRRCLWRLASYYCHDRLQRICDRKKSKDDTTECEMCKITEDQEDEEN